MSDARQSLLVGFASIGAIKVVNDVTGHSALPLTGYQYAKAGGEYLDKSLAILNGPRGETMDDQERRRYLRQGEKLVPQRQNLDVDTKTYTGSFRHRNSAKKFHDETEELHSNALSSSHKAEIEKSLREIDERSETANRRVRDQEERDRQRRQIRQAVPPLTVPDYGHPSQSNAYSQYPSSQAHAYPQNPSSQAHAYPQNPSSQAPAHPQYSSTRAGPAYPPAAYYVPVQSQYPSRR